jgi:formylglycine-generating enzyme required for sulfatase activity
MGSEKGKDYEKPVRRVQMSQPFYLGKYPVTQEQWQLVMGNNPSHFTSDLNRPVENVSWNDIQEFFQKLSIPKGGKAYRLENMPPNEVQEFSRTLGESGKGSLYRLPTEAE